MERRQFIALSSTAIVAVGGGSYLPSKKHLILKPNTAIHPNNAISLTSAERTMLSLASLAPSGHNAQPWFVTIIQPYHWIIGNDSSKWLPAVDPTQRETILSIGAFIQNLEYAANHLGYACQFTLLAKTNQDVNVVEVKLTQSSSVVKFDIQKIQQRRTLRSHYLKDALKKEDIGLLTNEDTGYCQFFTNSSKEHLWLNEQTIEANRVQAYRDAAESELSNWIRFTHKDAKAHSDGLTMASMEIEGFVGWYLRNFYDKADVMKNSFRKTTVDSVKEQVAHAAGWLIITSKDNSVAALLETGKRLQRILLKIRERNIAIHPMSQILEEKATQQKVQAALGIKDSIQFILRVGYVEAYPLPVALRRPVDWFVRS